MDETIVVSFWIGGIFKMWQMNKKTLQSNFIVNSTKKFVDFSGKKSLPKFQYHKIGKIK
jgi:hypothetical protein